jgi:uncharacterized repeat protein (TIGR04076 family)
MAARVRITVLKRTLNADFLAECATHTWEPCDAFSESKEFIVERDAHMPPGFCSWAWCDIQKYVLALARGSDFVGSRPGVTVACCTDGYRPVPFKIERAEPECV